MASPRLKIYATNNSNPMVEIYRASDGWHWRLIARNGRIVAASSEPFSSTVKATKNLKRTRDLLTELLT